ncbi:MAG TPA: CPCC family cysteine-rich protein, partial [Solirubrobacteraceae bacterium]
MSPSPSEQHPGPKATVEERLWVRLRDGGGEAFIVGEGHTHRDRFAIRARGEAESRLCSQYELAQVSVAAADWLSGFLHGRLPRPPEDPKLMTEWREKREIFLRCGAWPGRSEYHHYGTGHALSECAEVRVEPTEGADPELAAVRGHLGVVVDLLEAEPADRSPTYFVMLDAQAAAESEGWAIEEQDLNPTGKHRPDYDPAPRFTCPCCGFLTLPDPERGSYEICPVCFWED